MNPIKAVTSFLRGSPQNSMGNPPAPVSTDALGRVVTALDAAADGSSPTGKTDRPLGYPVPSAPRKGPRQEQIEAERIRAELRADTERMRRENQRNAEQAEREQAAAVERQRAAIAEKANSWEERYRVHRPASAVTITEPLLAVIIRRNGLAEGIRTRALKVQSHVDAWDVAFEARGKFTATEFKRQLFEDMEENETMLKAGVTDLRKLPDAEAFHKQASTNRQICKAAQQKAADAINPVLMEIADELQAAARKLAIETEKQERKTAFEFGVNFEPSIVLRALVSAGYELRQFAEYNWKCSSMTCPRETMFGILDANKVWQ